MAEAAALHFADALAIGAKKRQETLNKFPPVIFLDSVKVDLSKTYLNLQDIQDINIVNGYDSINKTNGRIYLTMKAERHLFLTFQDILKKQNDLKGAPILLFIIDDKIITDTTKVRIESSVIKKVEIIKNSDIKYWNNGIPRIAILKIETSLMKPKESTETQIRLRGNN